MNQAKFMEGGRWGGGERRTGGGGRTRGGGRRRGWDEVGRGDGEVGGGGGGTRWGGEMGRERGARGIVRRRIMEDTEENLGGFAGIVEPLQEKLSNSLTA